jgi:hypothetical protein
MKGIIDGPVFDLLLFAMLDKGLQCSHVHTFEWQISYEWLQ